MMGLPSQPAFSHGFGRFLLRSSSFTRSRISSARCNARFRASLSSDSEQKPYGFIGLGIMGAPMLLNLTKDSKRKIVAWNRSKDKCDGVLAKAPGGTVEIASSPREVVERCGTTFMMLSTPEAVNSVLHGTNGALEGCSNGKAIIDCSTLTVGDAQRNDSLVRDRGAMFLEAPVSGSKVPAEQGSLVFLCAGNKKVYDGILDCLDIMGKKKFFFGEQVGQGTAMKLVANMIMGSMLASLAEGITLAEKCGMDANQLVDVLSQGAMANPMFSLKGPKMGTEAKNYEVNFPLEHAQKDLRFAALLGDDLGIPLPVCSAANEVYKGAKGLGFSRHDFSAVIESLRASSNR